MTLQAELTLHDQTRTCMNAKRIALLEAVGLTGSITAAARHTGLSYKAAWDALDMMQNSVTSPLLQTTAGGRGGGGTQLSPAALQLIESWHRLQARLAKILHEEQSALMLTDLPDDSLLPGFMMRTSARNVFSGKVVDIFPAWQPATTIKPLLADICIDAGAGLLIHSSITRKSVENLGLTRHRRCQALIKASFIKVVPREQAMSPEKNASGLKYNRLCGIIRDFVADALHTEITVELNNARSITATCRKEPTLSQPRLSIGCAVVAQFAPADVILATC